jgi:hypothetical protein
MRALRQVRASDLGGRTSISLGSGCDLFMKYVNRAFLEFTVILYFPISWPRHSLMFCRISEFAKQSL